MELARIMAAVLLEKKFLSLRVFSDSFFFGLPGLALIPF